MARQPTHFHRRSHRGFTLVELMISIAMVLVLMIGINQIFKFSADTVGSGMAVSAGMRDLRAARQVLANDFTQMTEPGSAPFLIICNWTQQNALNAGDLQRNGQQSHRLDIFQMFTSGAFHRRTGTTVVNATAPHPYVNDVTASDQWIWIGHVRLPTNVAPGFSAQQTANYTWPGTGNITSNPNNFYANQWVLGRVPMLMVGKDGTGVVRDSSGAAQWYTDITNINQSPPLMQPLAYNSRVNGNAGSQANVSGSGNVVIQSSFTDIAGIDRGSYRSRVQAAYQATNGPIVATRQMLFTSGNTPTASTMFRFAAKPWLTKTALGGGLNQNQTLQLETALETPIFLRGCSQFIVEYAGDYVQQDASAKITAVGANPVAPELDWDPVFDSTGNIAGRQIRWYGMPRSTGATGPNVYDVRPLAWYRNPANWAFIANPPSPISASSAFAASFERLDISNASSYICAWSPDDLSGVITTSATGSTTTPSQAPWLIRLTIRVDDPNGRLPDGQTIEVIYQVPTKK